ncbi:hypothetical protein LOK49_LG01G01672 [Camellia lanceoleosa]|uniref:Uncharacterized protein n=1 Tax=Camellia lanceoleosa TaxID=1840588 RepID=A0ACC0IVG6_9ERIC|nr:hypothetical protein LOK49_LG01G01672 [Camellia lanceoleosa]
MGGFLGGRRVSKLLLIQGTLDSLLRGGGNLYSVRDKPMPKAIIELRRGFETVSKLSLIQGTLDSLLRGGGNLYSIQDKPMPEAMVELWRGMTGLDAKKQTAEMKDGLDLARCNTAETKTLNEIVTAISIKMNIPVPFFPHVTPGSPSPPPPPPISNHGRGNGGNSD